MKKVSSLQVAHLGGGYGINIGNINNNGGTIINIVGGGSVNVSIGRPPSQGYNCYSGYYCC